MSRGLVLLALTAFQNCDLVEAGCYDNVAFDKSSWTHCKQVTTAISVYAGKSGDFMMLGMDVAGQTGKWTSLALASNGGMKGARTIVVRQNDGTWIAEDRYAQDYSTPTLFSKQDDVRLIFAKEANGGTAWGVLLGLNPCQPKENGYETNFPLDADVNRWMLWAVGSSHTFAYHGTMRGQFHMNLISGPHIPPSTEGHKTLDIVMPNVAVQTGPGGSDAKNPYICTMVDLDQLGKDSSVKHHVSKFSALLDPNSAQYVHHMILFECSEQAGFPKENAVHGKVIEECESMPKGCYNFKVLWAVGVEDIVFPSDAGAPFGAGSKWFGIQMHYYNPQLIPNARDSSGFRLHFAPTVRKHDVGVFELNGGTSNEHRDPLQANQAEVVLKFSTPRACTGRWAEPINIIGTAHHAHLVGTALNIDVVRDGQYRGQLRTENQYDFNHQSIDDGPVKTLHPGDELSMKCRYDTSSRSFNTTFGDLTQNEMCYSFFMYYPAQKFTSSETSTLKEKTDGQLKLETASWVGKALKTQCGNPGDKENFTDVSERTQRVTLQPGVEFMGWPDSYGITAAKLCNDGLYDPKTGKTTSWWELNYWIAGICPQSCAAKAKCTNAFMKTYYAKELTPRECGNYGLSVWPDTSRTTPIVHSDAAVCSSADRQSRLVDLFTPTNYSVPACVVKGDLSSDAATAIITSITSTSVPTTATSTNVATTMAPATGKVLQARVVLTVDDPIAFVSSPHAKPVMKQALANASAELTEDMIVIDSIVVSSGRRLSPNLRRLAGGVDCKYTVTYPPSHTGTTFTAASIDTMKLKTAVNNGAANLGLNVTVAAAIAHEPQVVAGTPVTTTPGVVMSGAMATASAKVVFALVWSLLGLFCFC